MAAWMLAGIVGLFASQALATTPGTPGTPQAPTTVFTENFENGQTGTLLTVNSSAMGTSRYVGAQGQTYTADTVYIDLKQCDGWIPKNGQATLGIAMGCIPGSQNGQDGWITYMEDLAYVLGQYQGENPANNHAVVEGTNAANNNYSGTMLQTSGIALPSNGRFVTFSVNVAEYCAAGLAMSQDSFNLLDGANVVPMRSGIYSVCSDPNARHIAGPNPNPSITPTVGTFTGDRSFLTTSTSIGFQITNAQTSGSGNDQAFDNFLILDVTPQLDKSFAPTTLAVGDFSLLTFTITNTSELAAKNGWSFTDTLPAGLTFAGGGSTCPAGAFSSNGSSITATGNLNAGMASCTFDFVVTSASPGTYTNGASNITASKGLNPPGNASITFVVQPTLVLNKALATSRFTATDQFTMSIRAGSFGGATENLTTNSTTAGTGSTIASGTGTTGVTTLAGGSTYVLREDGAGTPAAVLGNYTATIACTDANKVQTGLPSNQAYNAATGYTITPVYGAAIACTITNAAISPQVSLSKSAPATTALPGGQVVYTIVAGNVGSVSAANTVISDPLPAGVASQTWTCSPSGGAACPNGSGSGALNETLATFPAGSTVTYSVTATLNFSPPAQVTNTATAAPPSGGVCAPGNTPPPCTSTATVTVKLTPAVPAPLDARWMLWLMTVMLAYPALHRLIAERGRSGL